MNEQLAPLPEFDISDMKAYCLKAGPPQTEILRCVGCLETSIKQIKAESLELGVEVSDLCPIQAGTQQLDNN